MSYKPLSKLLLFLFLLVASVLTAQPPTGLSGGSSRTPAQQGEVLLDTFDVYYFYADNPNQEIPFSDTSLINDFRQYDPVRRFAVDYRHLGNLGSAHEPIFFQAVNRRGFDVGLNQFDLYTTTGKELRYYRVEQPFSEVSYTLGGEQADGYTRAKLSRNFANGLNYTLDYNRINQLGDRLQYPNQNTRNTAFTNGMWFAPKGGKYESFFSFANNTIEQEDNGGVTVEPERDGEFNSANSAEVFIDDARSRYAHRELMYTQYYRFGGGVDSIKGQRRAFTVAHQAIFNTSTYKYYDDITSTQDTLFFSYHPALFSDERGIRRYFRHRKLENSFKLATFRLAKSSSKGAQNQRDLFEVGAVQSFNWITETGADTTINNLFLTGRYRFNPNERLLIDLNARLGLWDNAGDYRLSGELYFDFKKLGSLRLEGINQLYSPTFTQHRLYLTEKQIYNNNFDKTLSTTLSATYSLPSVRFSASGQYHLLNNYIYFDTTGLPVQTGVPISIIQLQIQKNFKLGPIHLDNTVALQQASEDFIRIPSIYSKHSLYYAGRWFKALDVMVGFDLRMNDTYFAHYYNPVTGQFQLQDRKAVDFYPALDAFLSFKVTRFRAFVKFENATALIDPGTFYYQTAFYPHFNSAVRIGITWRFLN
ncbi:MAG: putative porin [Chitinophagales bacterium]|nr:putative porin [Chitinophagales bacterium]